MGTAVGQTRSGRPHNVSIYENIIVQGVGRAYRSRTRKSGSDYPRSGYGNSGETPMVKFKHNQPQEDAQRIRNYLTDIRSRMYRQALLQTVTMVLFCGLILLAILFIINRLMPLPMQMSNISWMVLFVSAIIGVCLSGRIYRLSPKLLMKKWNLGNDSGQHLD